MTGSWKISGHSGTDYEQFMVPTIFGPWAAIMADFVEAGRGERVLDVACGTGAVARELVGRVGCNIILSDDGLQHLALPRDIEIAVVDGLRRFGNQRCMPAGPLREPLSRISSVDMVISNGATGRHEYMMEYIYGDLVSLGDENEQMEIETISGSTVHAIAGIGNPARFFSYLRGKKLQVIKHEYPDHHGYSATDIHFGDGLPVVMTEKDAVKCIKFASKEHWYLPIIAKLPEAFEHRFEVLLKEIIDE